MKPAQKTDLPVLHPMPTQRTILLLDQLFSKDESALLKLGFMPHEMEDKWFIYFEDNVLYFHRSWTGNCIYQVFFTEMGATLCMIRAIVNRDPQQYQQTDDEYDAEAISRIINTFLLHR